MAKEAGSLKFAADNKTKNMKKLTLSALAFILISIAANAQSERNLTFSIGPELSLPTGSFSQTHSIGTGGTAQLEILLQDKLKGTATVGLLAYLGKSIPGQNANNPGVTIIPVRVGAKYYFVGAVYIGAQIGLAFRGNNDDYKGTAFAYSPLMLGYEFKTNSDKAIDATIKYDASSGHGGTIGAIGLRLAYIF